ncbi:NOSIC,Nop domain,NOP5, N-terminal [Cinara cedri]|uniref:NOSIC,Nop domain,NOP5, N-terminal n=1 Tax=Cinara cedri TaxID=506608 RepID=A0A5E4N3J4_9HEMI|nr:NOSIC,Nop domain,NOP5, N-terminal [Cinara cedri]
MLVLFETSAGYAIFKVLDEKKLKNVSDLYSYFESPEDCSKIVKLKHFQKFEDTTEALASAASLIEGKLCKSLKKVIKSHVNSTDSLMVADPKLGVAIKEKFNVSCVSSSSSSDLLRCIRSQFENLLVGLPKKDLTAMSLGLAHSLSRYKLKFSPDKIDTMIVQAIGLLDELDKEVNNYIMRCREWYGWHFPELGKILTDNLEYVKTIKTLGMRENAKNIDLSSILSSALEDQVKTAAEISMGTEIAEDDIQHIVQMCDEILAISNYRSSLSDYLKSRMMAVAPNVTVLVGDLVGARMLAQGGSLVNVAKMPASTIQLCGAEKALFRALKKKHDTPKYGLIYHSSLVGRATAKVKGRMSRMLAAKVALAARFDAFGESETINMDLGTNHLATLEYKLRLMEEGSMTRISGTAKAKAKFEKYQVKREIVQYSAAADSTIQSVKRKREDENPEIKQEQLAYQNIDIKKESEVVQSPKKKKKKMKEQTNGNTTAISADITMQSEQDSILTEEPTLKSKKKKRESQINQVQEHAIVTESVNVPKKKKKKKQDDDSIVAETTLNESVVDSGKKKKKKNKNQIVETEIAEPVEVTTEKKKKKKKKN